MHLESRKVYQQISEPENLSCIYLAFLIIPAGLCISCGYIFYNYYVKSFVLQQFVGACITQIGLNSPSLLLSSSSSHFTAGPLAWNGARSSSSIPRRFDVPSEKNCCPLSVPSLSLLSYSLVPSLSFCVGDLVTSRNDIAHSFNCVYREQYSSLIWCNTLDVKGRYTSSSPPAGMCRFLKSRRLSRKQVQHDLYRFLPRQCRLGTAPHPRSNMFVRTRT